MTALLQDNLQSQQHLLYTTLDYLEVPWLYAQPATICLGLSADSSEVAVIKKAAPITVEANRAQMSWRAYNNCTVYPVTIESLSASLTASRVSLCLRAKTSFSDIKNDLQLFFTARDSYMLAVWQIITQCSKAEVYVGAVLLATVQPQISCTARSESDIILALQHGFALPGSIGISLCGFNKILWPEACNSITIELQLSRKHFWPTDANCSNTFLQTLLVENIDEVVSEPWSSVSECASYFLTQAQDCKIHSVVSVTGSNYQQTWQWYKHNKRHEKLFYSYPLSVRDGWALELSPIISDNLVYSAKLNVMPDIPCNVTNFVCSHSQINTKICGLFKARSANKNFAHMLAWHNLRPCDLQTLQQFLQPICADPLLKTMLQAIIGFSCVAYYSYKPPGVERIIKADLQLQSTGFAPEIIYLFAFYLQRLLAARLKCNLILIVRSADCGRLSFAN